MFISRTLSIFTVKLNLPFDNERYLEEERVRACVLISLSFLLVLKFYFLVIFYSHQSNVLSFSSVVYLFLQKYKVFKTFNK